MTVKVLAVSGVAPSGSFQGPNTGSVSAGADGTFTIDPRDMAFALGAGYVPARTDFRLHSITTPAAASSGLLFASAALTNGTKAIAADVDVMRQIAVVVIPNSPGITAGTLTLTYDANDGTIAQVDVLPLATPFNTNLSLFASKGSSRMRSQVIAGLTGGGTPGIFIGTTAALAVPIPPGAQDAAIVSEFLDAAIVSVANAGALTSAGIYTPHTVPNATHNFAVTYNTLAQ
jgi:hypothetical protein